MTKIRERCRENSITFSQYKLNYKNWENVPDIIHLLKRKTNLKQALTKYKQVQVEKRKRCTRCPYRFVNITNYLFMELISNEMYEPWRPAGVKSTARRSVRKLYPCTEILQHQ